MDQNLSLDRFSQLLIRAVQKSTIAKVPTGTDPFSVAVDTSGKFVYVVNTLSGNISAYAINVTTGSLTSMGTTTAGTNPMSVATTGTIQ